MHVIQLEWLPGVVWPTAMGSNSRTCCLTCSRAHNGYIVYSRRDWAFVVSPVRNKVAQWIMPKFNLARTGLGRWCLCDGQLGQIWLVKTSKILAWVKNSTSRWKKKKIRIEFAHRTTRHELWTLTCCDIHCEAGFFENVRRRSLDDWEFFSQRWTTASWSCCWIATNCKRRKTPSWSTSKTWNRSWIPWGRKRRSDARRPRGQSRVVVADTCSIDNATRVLPCSFCVTFIFYWSW